MTHMLYMSYTMWIVLGKKVNTGVCILYSKHNEDTTYMYKYMYMYMFHNSLLSSKEL